jgi:hypothetical protein
MADLNRSHLIDLLRRLGDGDDATALAAAREASGAVKDAGLTWDELLQPEDATVVSAQGPSEGSPARPERPVTAGSAQGDISRLLERLLSRTDISDTLRADLVDFRKQIADGKLHKDDADYIRALVKRLGS